MAERVLLIGMMGAGKTTVGRRLADRLGWRYVDSDEQVVAMAGRTVREIFEEDGEAAFRKLETTALQAAVAAEDRVVVGVAGGAILDPDNRRLLRTAGLVVWLRAPVEVLAERARRQSHRPLLDGDPGLAMRGLYALRESIYEELADLIVDVSMAVPDDVVDQILRAVA